MTLVVMAAGRGSRFGGMKQLAGIGPAGEALFDYSVYDALGAGFDDVVFVVSDESREPVEAHVQAGCGRHAEVRYALQQAPGRSKPWGTGHALLCAASEVDGAFGVVNADDFYGRDSFELLGRELAGAPADHVLVGFGLRDSLSPNGGVSRGVCRHEDGVLTEITELHDLVEVDGVVRNDEGVELTGDELISANLWGFQPSFAKVLSSEFDRFQEERGGDPESEFMIGEAVASLPDYGDAQVRVVRTPEKFLGMTYAEDVAAVSSRIVELVESGRYPSPLWG
jgi:NDP-sugar pyrophosphorylase family protein